MSDENKELQIPGPQCGYTDLIDQAMMIEKENKPYYPLRPSAAGYCSRRLAYDLMQYKGYASYPQEQKSPEVQRLLALGSSVEIHSIRNFDLLKSVDEDLKVKYKQQLLTLFRLDPVDKEEVGELIEGSMDLAIMRSNTGGLLDVKSAKDKFSQSFKTYWDESTAKFNAMSTLIPLSETAWYADDLEAFLEELNDPFFADNFHQLNVYCCSQFAKDHNIDHGAIYRYNKNDSRHIEIRFKPSESLYNKFKDKCNMVNKAVAVKKPEIVKKDYALGSIRCAFCPYKAQCWSEDALKAFFKKLPNKNWPLDLKKFDPKNESGLAELFEAYEHHEKLTKKQEILNDKLLKILVEQEITKIRLDNGSVYEVKYLKSPKPHFELRKSKV